MDREENSQNNTEIVSSEQENVTSNKSSAPAVADEVLPDTLVLLPLPGRPFFPGQVQPVALSPATWQSTIDAIATQGTNLLGLVYVDEADPTNASIEQFPETGCVVRLHRPTGIPENSGQFLAQGLRRFRIIRWLCEQRPLVAQVNYPRSEGDQDSDEVKAYAMAIIAAIKQLLPLNPLYSEELKQHIGQVNPNQPSLLADFAAALTTAKGDRLQEVLETLGLPNRMEKVLKLLKREREVAELQGQITSQVNDKVSANQREFFLREQLKIIQRELGLTKDDATSDLERYHSRMKCLKPPSIVSERIDEELDKLRVLESGSPEYGVTRNYLDWATSVPWGTFSTDNFDLSYAREQLNAHHDGLADVKSRIIEFLAVGVFKGSIDGSILLLIGPPGVGKTSIGKSVAAALDRKFYRFSLGGMRDEAEIKGHRRTYVGAMPGKLVQALKEVKVANPVILLDEIDKVGTSFQGDPASALLEVLDPEQNREFLDHYLDLRVDLSKILFICTANQLDTIPGALLDRMEEIRLPGYIAKEKLAIAKNHLWPKLLTRHGAKSNQIKISDAALRLLIDSYSREAGIRGLEKRLSMMVRASILKMVEGTKKQLRLGRKEVEEILGQAHYRPERAIRGKGVVMGLAWTAAGGATLSIESSKIHDLSRGFKLTGHLGDVMKESAEIAYSYVVANLGDFASESEFFDMAQIHMHVPEGATPKDGPSAGITMATSLVSLARGAAIRTSLAMSGELTLTGHVLPVGGIREKIIAARRARVSKVILPLANRVEYELLPDYLQEGIEAHFVSRFGEVFKIVFQDSS